jgi:hypothetical protein
VWLDQAGCSQRSIGFGMIKNGFRAARVNDIWTSLGHPSIEQKENRRSLTEIAIDVMLLKFST